MEALKLFFTDYTLQVVSLGSALLGIISGVLGSFAVIRKEGLLGDAVSHAALPGIALAFLLTNSKNTEILLLGALASGLIAAFIILSIVKNSRIKFDSALALVLSVFFGGGLVLLTHIQKIPNANQAGLDKFIFGQASTLLERDVNIMIIMGFILLTLVVVFWKEFKIVSFDPDFAESLGFSTKKVNILLSIMIVTAIIIGLQTVGVILMSAMIIAPSAASRQWTDKLSIMVILSAVFGALSGIIGTVLSSIVDKLPTGPSIVIVLSIIVFISLAIAPKRGLLWRYIRDRKNHKSINEYMILSDLYNLAMNHKDHFHSHDITVINPSMAVQSKGLKELHNKLKSLKDKGMVVEVNNNQWSITNKGIDAIENQFKGRENK